MKFWIPVAVIAVIAISYALFYFLSTDSALGSSPFGLVNIVGLGSVFIGLVAAGLLIKRARPHE